MFDRDFYVESKLKGFIDIDKDEYVLSPDCFDIELLQFLLGFGLISAIASSKLHGVVDSNSYTLYKLELPLGKINKLEFVNINNKLVNKALLMENCHVDK